MSKHQGLRGELERIRAHVDALFEDALVDSGYGGRSERPPGTWSPSVDVVETDEAYLLYAEVPGIDRDSIDLHAEGGTLVLSGRREPPAEATGFLRMERSYGGFRRVFEFATAVDADHVSARFERGILEIKAMKVQRSGRKVRVRESG